MLRSSEGSLVSCIESSLTSRAEIQRRAAGLDDIGRECGAYATVATVACLITTGTAKEIANRISGDVGAFTGYFAVSSGLQNEDKIISDGRTYDVVWVQNHSGEFLLAELREVRT